MPTERIDCLPDDATDEVVRVLTALRRLADGVASPLVRSCLESAAADIAYLTGTGDEDA